MGTLLVLEAGKVQVEEVQLESSSCIRGLCEGGTREPRWACALHKRTSKAS